MCLRGIMCLLLSINFICIALVFSLHIRIVSLQFANLSLHVIANYLYNRKDERCRFMCSLCGVSWW